MSLPAPGLEIYFNALKHLKFWGWYHKETIPRRIVVERLPSKREAEFKPQYHQIKKKKKRKKYLSANAHACNTSYSGGRNHSSKPTPSK
jgi:hypothetical protein